VPANERDERGCTRGALPARALEQLPVQAVQVLRQQPQALAGGPSEGAQVVRCQPEQLPVQAEQQLLADDAPTTALHSPVSMALLPPLPPLTM